MKRKGSEPPSRDHHRRAWNWLMEDGPPGFPGRIAGDFETAIGALEVEGKEQSAFREFWEEMRLAAEASGLHDRAFRYGRLAREADSAMEAFHQQSESGEGPGCPAWYAATRVVEKDPEHGWELILALVPIASDDSLTFIAVGPLESLLKGHAENHIDRIEAQAAEDPRFRECLSMAQIFEEDCPPGMRWRLEKLEVRTLHSDGDDEDDPGREDGIGGNGRGTQAQGARGLRYEREGDDRADQITGSQCRGRKEERP